MVCWRALLINVALMGIYQTYNNILIENILFDANVAFIQISIIKRRENLTDPKSRNAEDACTRSVLGFYLQ